MANNPESPDSPAPDAAPAAINVAPSAAPGFRPRRRLRRRWLLVLLGLLVVGGILVLEVPQLLSSSSGETIWQSITDGINIDGTVPKQTALEAFAYDFKVSVPGVTVPNGVDGGDAPTSGTGIFNWIHANWSALTPDQQAVVDRYLPPASTAGTIQMTPPPTAGESAGAAAQPKFQLDAVINSWPVPVNVAPDASMDLARAMAGELMADIAHIGPKLGMPVLSRGTRAEPLITLTLSDVSGGDDNFRTLTWGNSVTGYYFPCEITAWKNAWGGEQATSGGGVSPRLHVLITHEVVHCYQNVVWGNQATADLVPGWLKEGTAMWLAADDTKIQEDVMASMWKIHYVGDPGKALTARTYDSYGYFALLAQQGRDLWKLMLPAWEAAAQGPERSNAFISALGGDDPDIRNNWAESYLRRTDWGDPWIMYGFGLPGDAQVKQVAAQAQPDPGWLGSLPTRSNTVLNVTSTSGEVVTVATDGLASLHDNNGVSALAFQAQNFCVSDKACICPPDSLLAGQTIAGQKLTLPFVVAFNAPDGGSKYSIIGAKLADICKTQPTPQPKAKGKNPKLPGSNGDPHMTTVNAYHYDFQAAGEFTLLRSADGSVDIQARQEPYGTSQAVSINTAIAAKVGSHRVGVYVVGSKLQAHVDGQTVDLSAGPKDLGGGGRISASRQGIEIDFPDGTRLWALSVGNYGINAQVSPSAGLTASGVGLLGPIVAGGLGVPALPDGSRLAAPSSTPEARTIVYGKFADAWRLTDATTLFDYDPGKSTAIYTIKPYPADARYATVADLSTDQTAAGNSACSSITDQDLHDNCVFDVGVTGDAGFAQSYQDLQGFIDTGAPLVPTPTASSSAAPATPAAGGGVSGAMTVAQNASVGGYAIGADSTVYLSVQTGQTTFSLMAIDPVAQKIVQQVTVPAGTPVHYAAGSVWLPGLVTDTNGHNCSVTRFDGQTLAQQATIAIPCSFGGAPQIGSDGDAVWFLDVTKYDGTTKTGAVLTRLDPTTNAPGTSVPLPGVGGYIQDSAGAIFYSGMLADHNYYRLTTGGTTFDSLGPIPNTARPGGPGLWVGSSDHKSAQYLTQAGTPAATIQINGSIVAGDANTAYVEVQGKDASGNFAEQLWRYPADGSAPTQLALSPTMNGGALNYGGDPLPISNGNGVLKLWNSRDAGGTTVVLLQWVPTK